jgi:AraC-like DNA-binding protein
MQGYQGLDAGVRKMTRASKPAIASALAGVSGVTRDGQPMSYNRAASPELAPWIARVYVTIVDAPADHRLECGLFNDTAFLRIQLAGDWTAQTVSGPLAYNREALFFGPQSRRMPLSVTGSFISIGISMRPGACHSLNGPSMGDHLDRIVRYGDLGGAAEKLLARFDPDGSPEEWMTILEKEVHKLAVRADGATPDPVTIQFEAASFSDPTISIADFARNMGVEQRRLERIIRRDFGLPPKQVLRRARALDMASSLRGVADVAEADELMLRFYDQSHLIREFSEFFGMSPNQFVATPQPILTLALESRQARRLEAMARLAPGEARPWE